MVSEFVKNKYKNIYMFPHAILRPYLVPYVSSLQLN